MKDTPMQKNIVYGSITAGGDVHIGDKIYRVERDFQRSILFLQLAKTPDGYSALLSVKSEHFPDGLPLFHEKIALDISPKLFRQAEQFEQSRLRTDAPTRRDGAWLGGSPQQQEEALSAWLADTFFTGDTGTVCRDFIHLLERGKIDDLHLIVSTEDDAVRNLPWEMVIPHLFAVAPGQAKSHLAVDNFTLARTTEATLQAFNLRGWTATSAPLKLLFVTALPENMDEHGKLLEIEDEARKLIEAVGGLEATGDERPKMVIEFLDCASLEEIDEALAKRHHDVVHISGHGAFREGQGLLFLENEDGDVRPVGGQELGEKLRRHSSVRLLLLSACESAVAGQGGMAEQLAAKGIPAVLAMRYAVTDVGARQFATAFYQQLADGRTLACAMDAGREALWQEVAQRRRDAPQIAHPAEWFTPVLYLNQHIGALVIREPYDEGLLRRFYPKTAMVRGEHTRLIGQGFIGRKRYLIQLRKCFLDGHPVCLHGMGGLGKTTLAEAFAHNFRQRFDVEDVLNFRGGINLQEQVVLDRLFRHWKSATKPGEFQAEEIEQALNSPNATPLQKLDFLLSNCVGARRLILIFDNFEDVQQQEGGAMSRRIIRDDLRDFYLHLLEKALQYKGLRILFTTRYAIADFEERRVVRLPLDKMSYAEQYRYLNFSAELRRIPLEQRATVHTRLDGHPRAMSFLESLLRNDPQFSWSALDALVGQVEQEVFADLLLEQLHARLLEAERSLFAQAALFFSRSPVGALLAATKLPEPALRAQLTVLQDWSLCFYEEKNDRFEVHALTRAWAEEQNLLDGETRKAVAKGAGVFFRDQPTWDDQERAIIYFEMAEAWEDFIKISFRLEKQYRHTGLYHEAFILIQKILKLDLSKNDRASALSNLGLILKNAGKYEDALIQFEEAMAIMKSGDNKQGVGALLSNIGIIFMATGKYDLALSKFKKSLNIIQKIKDDKKGESAILDNIGQIYRHKGKVDIALSYYQRSLKIRESINDDKGISTTLSNIGHIYALKGEDDIALSYLEKSLKIVQTNGYRNGEATILTNITQIYQRKGDYDAAMLSLNKSLSIRREIGDVEGMANTLYTMGTMLFDQSKIEESIPFFMQAYSILYQIGSPNIQHPEGYLNNIIGHIGESRFQEILAHQNQ